MFPFKRKAGSNNQSTVAVERLRANYIRFCTGPFFTAQELSDHFTKLLREPIQEIGFTVESPSRLVIASMPISFNKPSCPSERFEIGPMLAFYSRDIEAPSKCGVRFERIIPAGKTNKGLPEVMHPHINGEGLLCINDGKTALVEAILHGDLLTAVRMTVSILNTYDSSRAYGDYYDSEYPFGYYGTD